MGSRRYKARWVTAEETRIYGEHNGVVVGPAGYLELRTKWFISPMALAERVASSLNVTEKFSNDELVKMDKALKRVAP